MWFRETSVITDIRWSKPNISWSIMKDLSCTPEVANLNIFRSERGQISTPVPSIYPVHIQRDHLFETSQELRMLSRSLSDCQSLTLDVMCQITSKWVELGNDLAV